MARDAAWRAAEIGEGKVLWQGHELRLTLPAADDQRYHDAQITDYAADKPVFSDCPPLRLSLLARAEGDIRGTAGFGFWNQAFVPGQRRFRLPQALWFFYASRHSNMALARGLPGHGWKAATFDARRAGFLALLPLGFLLMRSPVFYDRLWRVGQRAIGVQEAALGASLLDDFHRYTLEWRAGRATFAVDGEIVLRADQAPAGPLGFIAWIDNQYAIVTPQGRFGWGLVDLPRSQSLILRDISLLSLA